MSAPTGESGLQLDSPAGSLDAILTTPEHAVACSVLAHGAGAGIHHQNMANLAAAFAGAGVTTLRCNFPYMQAGKRRVDNKATAVQSISAAAQYLRERIQLPLLLAGHSFGGRMCTHAVADAGLTCDGLILCSFPLHPPKKPDVKRAAHIHAITQPVLFLSGTRDDLADAALLTDVAGGMPDARIHWLDTANHSYAVLKRTRTHPLSVFEEMSAAIRAFIDEQL